jgi:chromosome segregation ATPase
MNKNFDNVDVNNFTQKDLMLHLLQVSQHTVTREELKEDISKLEGKIEKLDGKIERLDDKIGRVEAGLKEELSKLKTGLQQEILAQKLSVTQDMTKLESNLKEGMSRQDTRLLRLENKFDRLQWFLLAGVLGILLKDYIIGLLAK